MTTDINALFAEAAKLLPEGNQSKAALDIMQRSLNGFSDKMKALVTKNPQQVADMAVELGQYMAIPHGTGTNAASQMIYKLFVADAKTLEEAFKASAQIRQEHVQGMDRILSKHLGDSVTFHNFMEEPATRAKISSDAKAEISNLTNTVTSKYAHALNADVLFASTSAETAQAALTNIAKPITGTGGLHMKGTEELLKPVADILKDADAPFTKAFEEYTSSYGAGIKNPNAVTDALKTLENEALGVFKGNAEQASKFTKDLHQHVERGLNLDLSAELGRYEEVKQSVLDNAQYTEAAANGNVTAKPALWSSMMSGIKAAPGNLLDNVKHAYRPGSGATIGQRLAFTGVAAVGAGSLLYGLKNAVAPKRDEEGKQVDSQSTRLIKSLAGIAIGAGALYAAARPGMRTLFAETATQGATAG